MTAFQRGFKGGHVDEVKVWWWLLWRKLRDFWDKVKAEGEKKSRVKRERIEGK